MSRLERYINEEYKTRVKSRLYNSTFELFGPTVTNKELQSAADGGDIRFIADGENQELWIWDALEGIHGDLWFKYNFINKGRKKYTDLIADNNLIWGIAEKRGSKWYMTLSDELSERDGYQIKLSKPRDGDSYDEQNYGTVDFKKIIENFKWLDRTINISKWLSSRGI